MNYNFAGLKQRKFLCLLSEVEKALAFLKKDFAVAVSYKLQFLFRFSQVFFAVAVIYFIGKMLERAGNNSVLREYDADYFAFALVGLAVTSYLKTGLLTITNDIRQIMNQGTLEAMCASPVKYSLLLFYSALWPFVFETIRVGFYFLIGMVLFDLRLSGANWAGAAAVMFITIPIFLILGVTSSSIMVVVKKGDPINWFFSSASALLAGTMFPVSVLPDWLRMIAFCLPLTHSLEAMRRFLLSGASFYELQYHLLALLIFLLISLPLAGLVNYLCMKRAKASGAFGTH